MTQTRIVAIGALIAVLLAPAPAFAHAGLWDWLEELSGPGPFRNGWMFDLRPLCMTRTETIASPGGSAGGGPVSQRRDRVNIYGKAVSDESAESRLACLANRTVETGDKRYSVAGYLEVRGGFASTPDTALFSDRPDELKGVAKVQMLQGFAMAQLHPAFAVGLGAGVIRFSGETITTPQKQFVLTPLAVAISPLKLFLPTGTRRSGLITVRFDQMAIHGHLRATDFNPASTSAFESKHIDAVRSLAVTLDLFAITH